MSTSAKLPERIATIADLNAGLIALRNIDPALAPILDGLKDVPLRNRTPGFEGLAEIIVSQHVSKASAAAIFGRLLGTVVPFKSQVFLDAGEQPLIEAGLPRAKQKTLTALAIAITSEGLDLEGLCALPIAEARAVLIAHPGIGPWTAEIFLMFCASHPDIFPAGDVALQHVAGQMAELEERPDEKTCRAIAERWQPLRSVAARVLYARYAQIKGREVVPV